MPFPNYQQRILGVLSVLGDGENHGPEEIQQKVAQQFELTDDELNEVKPGPAGGVQNKWVNDIAHVLAHKKDLISGSRPGPYRITPAGMSYLVEHGPPTTAATPEAAPTSGRPPGFLFQGNSRVWNIRAALGTASTFTYSAKRGFRQMWVGAPVFLWESSPTGGILAEAEILTEPIEGPVEPDRLWVVPSPPELERQVWIAVRAVFTPAVGRAEVQTYPDTSDLGVFRFAQATNYSLTQQEYDGLRSLLHDRPKRLVPPEKLVYITAASAVAKHHLETSLKAGIEIETFAALSDVYDILKLYQENGRVFAWGARPGQAAEQKWEKLNPGDAVLVYSDGKFVLAGRVYAKARSRGIAARIWGDDGTDTWECIFFLTDLVELDAARVQVVQELGYASNFIPQGFEIPSASVQETLRRKYAVLANFIASLKTSKPTPIPDSADDEAGEQTPSPPPFLSAGAVQARAEEKNLDLDPAIYAAVVAALNSRKNVIFTGPPGTAKTTLAQAVAAAAQDVGLCTGYVLTTATSDWTTYETIGGLRPQADGTLEFSEGHFLASIRENRWLVIDELNRSNFDRAFGQLFTALSGQPVVLPYERPEHAGKPLTIVPFGALSPLRDADVLAIKEGWRVIGTMNVFDKSLLFEMSYALMRRFAFIEIPSPKLEVFEKLIDQEASDPQARVLARKLLALRSGVKDIGPAVFMDIARYLDVRIVTGGPGAAEDMLFESFYSYLLPQFEGVTDEQGMKLFNALNPSSARDFEKGSSPL
jgi:MoxR-like ATPase